MGPRGVVKEASVFSAAAATTPPLQSAVILRFVTLKSIKPGGIVAYILKNFITDGGI